MFDQWRQRSNDAQEIDLIPVMNLFMVLIPVLLMGAAFFHVAVIPTSTPSHTPGSSDVPKTPKTVSASLVIEPDAMNVSFSSTSLTAEQLADLAASWQITQGKLPIDKLQRHLRTVKAKYPESTTLVVLPSGGLQYQRLVRVLDATREFESGRDAKGKKTYKELFPVTVFSKMVKGPPDDDSVGEATP